MAGRIFSPLPIAPNEMAKVSRRIGVKFRRALIGKIDMLKPLTMKNMPIDIGLDRPPKSTEQNTIVMYK